MSWSKDLLVLSCCWRRVFCLRRPEIWDSVSERLEFFGEGEGGGRGREGPEVVTVGMLGMISCGFVICCGFWGWVIPKLSNIWNFAVFAVLVEILWSMFKSFWVIVIFSDPGPVLSTNDFRLCSLGMKFGCSFW